MSINWSMWNDPCEEIIGAMIEDEDAEDDEPLASADELRDTLKWKAHKRKA